MLCPRPRSVWVQAEGRHMAVPCGVKSCLACRATGVADWSIRCQLEARCWPFSSFVTLTHTDDSLELTDDGLATVRKDTAQKFLKRFRYHLGEIEPGHQLRFMLIAEYGPRTLRPHYHAITFNIEAETFPPDVPAGYEGRHAQALRKAWPHGNIVAKPLVPESMHYVCAFHATGGGIPEEELNGREAGFRLQSQGLGRTFVPEFARTMTPAIRQGNWHWQHERMPAELADVNPEFRVNGHKLRMPAYIRTKLRQELHLPERVQDGRQRRIVPQASYADLEQAKHRERRYAKKLRQAKKL